MSSHTNHIAADPALPGVVAPNAELVESLRSAARRQPAALVDRAHHYAADGQPRFVNRLIRQGSPYLLQHAFNPVNWWPWCDEAFERAESLSRPVLLSIGYATCHWCHVMERESFEDLEIAEYINTNYVAIKVDREERPDVDALYMQALQIYTGRGGWPMTVMLLPDRRPFFAGTYFPARDGDRPPMPGFVSVLHKLRAAFDAEADGVVDQAQKLVDAVKRNDAEVALTEIPNVDLIAERAEALLVRFDPTFGGYGRAPKFPHPSLLELLMRHAYRSGSEEAKNALRTTLHAMASGGIYDHVGGGFHRYSTDTRWLVPHFEKMLYDNAQLAVTYLDGYRLLGDSRCLSVARDVLSYMHDQMQSPEGGFYAATDADSVAPDGTAGEGYYFTWSEAELVEAFGEDSEELSLLRDVFGVSRDGNFDGRNVLHVAKPFEAVATTHGKSPAQVQMQWEGVRRRLFELRNDRPAPLLDEKILAAWNGLAISAMARGSVAAKPDAKLFSSARRAAEFVWNNMRTEGGRLLRSLCAGQRGPDGVLDDYAFVIQGYLDLAQVAGDGLWLGRAKGLQARQDKLFSHDEGPYYLSESRSDLFTRQVPSYDGALPSGNAVSAINLLRLSMLTGQVRYQQRAARLLGALANEMRANVCPKLLSALDAYHGRSAEVVVLTRSDGDDRLQETLAREYLPNAVCFVLDEREAKRLASRVPWLAGKTLRDAQSTAFVCEQGHCQVPTNDPELFVEQLRMLKS